MSFGIYHPTASLSGVGSTLLIGGTVSYKVNDISTCTAQLGFSSNSGAANLGKAMHGTGGGAFGFGTGGIAGLGVAGSTSSYNGAIRLKLSAGGTAAFDGTLVGFSNSKSPREVYVGINGKGGGYNLTGVSAGSPGFLAGSATEAVLSTIDDTVIDAMENAKSPVGMVIALLRTLSENQEDQFRSEGAKKAWAQTIEGSQVLSSLGKIKQIRLSGTIFTGSSLSGMAKFIYDIVVQNPGISVWELLLTLGDGFGFNLISIGENLIAIPHDPVSGAAQSINPSDIVDIAIEDFQSVSPSRCVVQGEADTSFSAGLPIESSYVIGAFPSQGGIGGEPLRILYLNLPTYLSGVLEGIVEKANINYSSYLQDSRATGTQNKGNISDQVDKIMNVVTSEISEVNKVADKYAEYMLMKARYSQRQGSITTRFLPKIVPGLTCSVVDPAGPGSFVGFVTDVSHTLNYQSATAQTQITFSYLRYGDEPTIKNPLYGSSGGFTVGIGDDIAGTLGSATKGALASAGASFS